MVTNWDLPVVPLLFLHDVVVVTYDGVFVGIDHIDIVVFASFLVNVNVDVSPVVVSPIAIPWMYHTELGVFDISFVVSIPTS